MPYLMPSGKWRAKRMIQGKVKTKSFQTKQEAKKWESAQEAETWQQESSTIRMASLLDFNNAYLDMVKERFAQKTASEKKLAFKYLFKVVDPGMIPQEMTPAMALEVMRFIARTSSGNAANKARKNLVAAWEWGRRYYGLPVVNPFREVDKFPADTPSASAICTSTSMLGALLPPSNAEINPLLTPTLSASCC